METEEQNQHKEYKVEGYATTWTPYTLWENDGVKYFERIDPKAFENADMSDIIMQYDHEGKVLARTSNGSLNIRMDDRGLFISADLSRSAAAREMYEEIKEGLVTKMSWAFTVSEESYDKETRTRNILKVKKVYDVSAVSIPANDGTDITARSYINGVIDAERQELLERERELREKKRKKFLFETQNQIILGGILNDQKR